jgi:quercetin dioxygenase-like cupin family protein
VWPILHPNNYFACMDQNFFKLFADIPVKEIAPGYFSKFIHTVNNTINFIDVTVDSVVGNHQHVHEQLSFVLEGQFELTIDGNVQILDKGMYAVIPSNIWHSGRAITDCKLIDIFSPVREDYRTL